MLIPKNKKKELIDNPLRPKIGIPREHSVCRISWSEFEIEPDETVTRLRVDADYSDAFVEAIESTIPQEDRHRCGYHEVWLIDRSWKTFILEKAKECFDEVNTALRTW